MKQMFFFSPPLERAKGVFETVDAVEMLFDKGLPVSLFIAGDGPARQEIEAYVAGLCLMMLFVFLVMFGIEQRFVPSSSTIFIVFQQHMERACPFPYLRR